MGEFTVAMALVDLIPVILFVLAVRIILLDTFSKMGTFSKILYCAGVFLVAAAGTIKALYKLFAALGTVVPWMTNQFFANQSLGFLLAGIGMLTFAIKVKKKVYGFIPTMGLVGIMVGGLAILNGGYCVLCAKLGKKKYMILFILSLVFCMMMGYLSSRDFTQAYMNWVAQSINIVVQALLLVGCMGLHNAGLKDKLE